jgi:hypothetical protein
VSGVTESTADNAPDNPDNRPDNQDNPVASLLRRAAEGMRKRAGIPEDAASWGGAVAEWLETTAGRAEYLIARDKPDCGHEACRRWYCEMCSDAVPEDGKPAPELCGCWDGALTVATAWLGEVTGGA